MLMGIPFDDGLDQMMNMMRSVCVNLFSLVDDNLLGRSLGMSVPALLRDPSNSGVKYGGKERRAMGKEKVRGQGFADEEKSSANQSERRRTIVSRRFPSHGRATYPT